MTSLEEMASQITALVRAKTGDPNARVTNVERLPGHAAFGSSFVLERGVPGATPSGKFVLRLAPHGVRIAGPADVVLQARRMESLADSEVPVPPILWYGDEPEFFGTPYFVAGFVESFKLGDRPDLPAEEIKELARKGVRTLAALHRVDWRKHREVWGEPTSLLDEMKRLDHLLDRPTLDPKEVARAPELRARLQASIPQTPIGCVHGDFQWENILFADGRPAVLIDWEMALLGPTLLDLAILCFLDEPGRGVDLGALRRVAPLSADEIVSIYSESAKLALPERDVRWLRAFAAFRVGVLTCFNVMLHRRGKRPDPEWEIVVRSAPAMFERGLEMLG
jgi:aminoglycoside phosphotransferase (APT) family kinase protein